MVAQTRPIPLADQQRVYRILADEFEFGTPIPMATVAFALMEAGVDKEAYGYKKLKAFLAELDGFLSFTDIIAGGVPQRLVTINKREDWAAERTADRSDGYAACMGSAEACPRAGGVSEGAGSSQKSDDPRALMRLMAQSPDYLAGPVPRGIMAELLPCLSDFAYFPSSTLDILREGVARGTNVESLLDEDWSYAFEAGALRYYEGKVIFPLHVMRGDGKTPIEISIRHVSYQNDEEKPWYLCYVNTYVRPTAIAKTLIPSREIEKFARLGSWDRFLDDLAEMALPEPWDFGTGGRDASVSGAVRRKAILKSYICTTFYRLKLEDKICIDDGNTFAAFNTGLVTRCYDDIYACFEPGSPAVDAQVADLGKGGVASGTWRFAGFCTSGSRGLGKHLVKRFNPLPAPASYFERKEDLLFDLEKELIPDYDHMLIDNIDRLPLAFLEDEVRGNAEASSLLADIRRGDAAARAHAFGELGEVISDDARLFRRLRRCFSDAIDVARKRVRWNFKTAIPCYYPRSNSMGLLLPLCLVEDDVADVALVVQLMPSGNYQGQTILTMRQAYMNARLICRPDSEWLTTSDCGLVGLDDEE